MWLSHCHQCKRIKEKSFFWQHFGILSWYNFTQNHSSTICQTVPLHFLSQHVASYLQLWGSCRRRPAARWTEPSSPPHGRRRWWAGCGRGSWGCRWWRWTWGTWSEGTSWPVCSGAGWSGCTGGCWETRQTGWLVLRFWLKQQWNRSGGKTDGLRTATGHYSHY